VNYRICRLALETIRWLRPCGTLRQAKVGHTYKDFPLAKTASWLRADGSINVTAAVLRRSACENEGWTHLATETAMAVGQALFCRTGPAGGASLLTAAREAGRAEDRLGNSGHRDRFDRLR
jgi:hypothetical protein